MSDAVISSLGQVTAEWLTDVLTRSGALDVGKVESYTVLTTERELSSNARLNLTYSDNARGALPRNLFLKMVKLDMEDEFFGPSEVNYYIRDYVGVPDVPILRCYDGVYSEAAGGYHILLDDLADTHVPSREKPPSLEHGFVLAEGLAAMYAHWWGRERLIEAGEPIPDAAAINRFVSIARPGVEPILAECADQLAQHWPAAIYDLYQKHPSAMIDRTRDGCGFTLIHGDTNQSNVLVPIEGHRPIYIIDRQPFDWSLRTWLGVYDLSYNLVLKWDADVRRQLEEPILRHYLDHLTRRGVRDYSWDQLWDDYRLSAVMSVYVATEWCRGGLNRETQQYWLPMLQRSMTGFDDLDCALLWE
jgi:hypothetical protein